MIYYDIKIYSEVIILPKNVLNGVVHTRVATVSRDPTSEKMTFVLISNDNGGKRYDWDSGGQYEEVLDVNGARYGQLNTLFKDHDRGVDSAIATITNTRLEEGQIVSDVAFGSDSEAQRVETKYKEGILTDVSIGYEILEYKREEREGQIDLVTITDYEILEASAVGIGFDSGAKKREKEITMADKIDPAVAAEAVRVADIESENKRLKAEAKESKRVADIEKAGGLYKAEPALIARMVADKNANVHTLNSEILQARMDETPTVEVEVGGVPEAEKMRGLMRDSLSSRMGASISLQDNMFAEASLSDIAARMLGIDPMRKQEIASRALVTSEFPALLIDAGNRTLEKEFDAQASTWQEWTSQTELRDFRPVDVITSVNSGGKMDEIKENGELKEIERGESKRTWGLKSYGNKAYLTREVFINDDLGAFGNIPTDFAERAANRESGDMYDLLRMTGTGANFVMNDGKALFHVDHGNLGTTAFSSTALTAAKVAMRKQTGLNGTPLNILPAYLIVSPELESEAMTLLASAASIEDAKNNKVVNPHYKTLQLIVDSRLTVATEWYLATSSRTLQAGYLAGSGRRPKIQVNHHSIQGVEYETVFDFGVTAISYQGLYKGK